MTPPADARSLETALWQVPLLDAHTHVDPAHPVSRGLHDILLYHMVISDLYSAGCPSGARLSPDPDEDEAGARLQEALPFLPHIQNTACWWGVRIILGDLFGWHEPVTAENWRALDQRVRQAGAPAGTARAPPTAPGRDGLERPMSISAAS